MHVTLLALLCPVGHGDPAPIVRTYHLGRPGGVRVTARVAFTPWPAEPLSRFGTFTVRFLMQPRSGPSHAVAVDAGTGILRKTPIQAADFVGLGRRQLFLSAEYGGVTTGLFNCDGTTVRNLYRNDGGRVWVSLFRRHGRWHLREAWPKRQWPPSGPNAGVGYAVGGT